MMRTGRFAVLLAVQVLILNHIHIAGYITPLLIGYGLVSFQAHASRVGLLLWGFFIGVAFDLFSGTAGMASAACTLLAMVQPALLKMFAPHDASDDFVPTIQTLGVGKYVVYALLCMLVLHAAFYLLDAFTLHDWVLTLLSVFGGAAVAAVLCVCAELIVRKKKR